jgi:small subunit ribosomal protein S20
MRQEAKRRVANRYYKKTARTAILKLREMKDQEEAKTFLPKVLSMIDKLAKRNTWHANKAANLKSSLMRHVNGLNA